jgi:tetratricopeptide (TPR) repeat protein
MQHAEPTAAIDPDAMDPAVQHFHSAIEHYNHALNLARALSDRQFLMRCYKKLGSTYRTLRQPQLALEYLELYLKTARAVGTPKQKESAARLVADLLSDVPDDFASAAFSSDKALFERLVELRWEQAAAAQQADLKYYCLHAYFQLGRLMEDSGSYTQYYGPQKAAKHYQKVWEIGKELQLHELGHIGAQMVKEAAARLEALEAGSCVLS